MNYKSKLFILGLISQVFSAKFSVVSFDGACKLSVNNQQIAMSQPDPEVPLYTTNVDVPINTTYKYICGGKEDVERTLQGDNTHNELVGREKTITDMPEFGFPNKKPWTRSIGRTELFDPTYVPIVILDGGEPDFYTHANGKESTNFGKVTFILKDNFFKFNNIHATGKNYDENKFQFEVSLPGDGIYYRTDLKFRPSSFDPVFFRQILYGDIAHAIGNPAHESVAARVYLSDGRGFGLYVLQENCDSESFLRTAFYANPDGSLGEMPKGPHYDAGTGADFDPNTELPGFMSSDGTADYKNELLEMTKKLAQVDVMDAESVKEFDENWFELDTLFRALALEYLGGHWDSYWLMTTNFVIYHPPAETEGPEWMWSKLKFYFIDQDFDQTFGSNMKEEYDAPNYPYKPYTDYLNKGEVYWKTINHNVKDSDGKLLEPGTRILLDKFLGCDGKAQECVTKTYFENHLKDIVQHIFNPVAIGRKVEGYKDRYSEEIIWDTQLERFWKSPNAKYHFTYDDFIGNIDHGVGSFPYGIMDWTEKIANTVCQEFQIEYDSVALTPETAEQFEAQTIEAGVDYDADNLNSGSFMNTANIAMVTIATLLCSILLF